MTQGPFFPVGAHLQAAKCKSCEKPIYWIRTKAGRHMPVDCDVEGGQKPFVPVPGDGEPQNGIGVSHFATCPNAAQYRRPR
jgi:hypothetical protein